MKPLLLEQGTKIAFVQNRSHKISGDRHKKRTWIAQRQNGGKNLTITHICDSNYM